MASVPITRFEFPKWRALIPFSSQIIEHYYMVNLKIRGLALNNRECQYDNELVRLAMIQEEIRSRMTKEEYEEYKKSERFLPNPR